MKTISLLSICITLILTIPALGTDTIYIDSYPFDAEKGIRHLYEVRVTDDEGRTHLFKPVVCPTYENSDYEEWNGMAIVCSSIDPNCPRLKKNAEPDDFVLRWQHMGVEE